MTKMINITNCETGEEIIREMNEEELANAETLKQEALARAAKDAEKIAARKAVLERLGLTEEEAAVLFG